MASPPPPVPEEQTILFRPSKKRKIYRQRAQDDEQDNESASHPLVATISSPKHLTENGGQSLEELIASSGAAQAVDAEEVEGTAVSISEILRLRKKNKRAGGVQFSAEGQRAARENEEQSLVLLQEGEDGLEESNGAGPRGVPRRFAPQTGTVLDVNKHMMEYIDSQIAKRRAEEGSSSTSTTKPPDSNTIHTYGSTSSTQSPATQPNTKKAGAEVHRQPAALGKLVEIDLGAETRQRNEERTQRKLRGEVVSDDDVPSGKAPKKPKPVRLGPDGKPWRGRKRRGSEDLKRDSIVDQVLRENRLEIYDEPVVQTRSNGEGDEAADDRIAEAFRQEFMDAMSQRRQKKGAPPSGPTKKKGEEESLKGPKLGGSRNSRAAMRDLMLKAAKK